MKKEIHPKYQEVLFIDSTTGHRFVIGSTLQPKETAEFEGKKYPVSPLSTSAYSHPLFTGSKQLVDAEGRVDKFKKRYSAAQQRNVPKEEEKSEENLDSQKVKKKPAKKAAK